MLSYSGGIFHQVLTLILIYLIILTQRERNLFHIPSGFQKKDGILLCSVGDLQQPSGFSTPQACTSAAQEEVTVTQVIAHVTAEHVKPQAAIDGLMGGNLHIVLT